MNKATLALLAITSFQAAAQNPYEKLPEDTEKRDFVIQVLGLTGLHNEVRVVTDPSATGCGYATTYDGRQYIGLDPNCVGRLWEGTGYNWRTVGILTHEVGHLLGGHTTNSTNSHREESEADEWSGWMMARLGATLAEAETLASELSVQASTTHPARKVRMASVERGWRRGKALPESGQTKPPQVPAVISVFRQKLPWVK